MKNYFFLLLSFFCLATHVKLKAQYCSNNIDTIYGLNSITPVGTGQITGINVNNAGTTLIGSPASGSANANGLGFCSVDGSFYFFNQAGGGATEFVRFNPITGTKVSLAIPSGPALPTGVSGKIRSGTMNSDGTGYYFIFPGATMAMGYPKTAAALYYYSIGSNTWTLVTQTFVDITAATVAEITTLNSGDMAFDGGGNLWILSSKSPSYALYKIAAPVPTTAVASITLDIKIPVTAVPGAPSTPVGFTGVAFNSSGSLYLSTGSYTSADNGFNNKLYLMTSVSAPLTLIGTLPNGYGDDLTSCTFPYSVLASSFSFKKTEANLIDGKARLSWEVFEEGTELNYTVEYGTDISQLRPIAVVPKKHIGANETAAYSFLHEDKTPGVHYYRIKENAVSSQPVYSDIKRIVIGNANKIYIGPNPSAEYLQVNNMNPSIRYVAAVYDCAGKLMCSKNIDHLNRSVNISQLRNGVYILHLLPVDKSGDRQTFKFVKR